MANDIADAFLQTTGRLPMASAQAINDFFTQRRGGNTFNKWFNANAAGDAVLWDHRRIPDRPETAARFAAFWDDAGEVFGQTPNLMQFICLECIFVNEINADLVPIEEKVGRQGHPGLAYAFDAIPGVKRSYNTLSGNLTAFDLFRDPAYRQAHAGKPLASEFPTPADVEQAWKGEAWPQGFATSVDPAQTGFLQEADFYKFRGRGLIQTTGRANYTKLIHFIRSYTGNDPVLQQFARAWTNVDDKTAASTSSNDDWHRLFFSGRLELAKAAVRIHNQGGGGYLAIAVDDPALVNEESNATGSVFNMGLRISGSQKYAATFKNRVAKLCELLAPVVG